MNTKLRAPKGGVTIAGTFYKGGQFLPEWMPKQNKAYKTNSYPVAHSAFNTKTNEDQERKALAKQLFHIIRNTRACGFVLKATSEELAAENLTRDEANALVNRYNKLVKLAA